MKSTFTKILLAFCFVAISSCEDEADPKVSAGGFALRSTEVTPVVLTPADDDNVVTTFNWDKSDNGMSSVSAYQIQIAESGTNFANAVTGNNNNNITTADRSYVLKVKELNQLINQLPGFQCGQEISIDVRIKSTLGQGFYNGFVQYSTNVITLRVTPYSSDQRILAFAKAGQDLEEAAIIKSSSYLSQTDYEGHMYLEPGSYKLYKPNSCGSFTNATVYGLTSGNMVEDGTDTYNVSVAGHYFVKANLTTGAYTILPYTSFGIYGEAKGIPYAANKPMVYDATTKTWSLTFDLFKGKKFKFRAVNVSSPAVIYGVIAGKLVEVTDPASTAADIKVPGTADNTKQSYTMTINVSDPRNYQYSLEAN